MFCPNCGNPVNPTDYACGNCGRLLQNGAAPAAPRAAAPVNPVARPASPEPVLMGGMAPQRQPRKKWPWFVGGGVLLAAIAAVLIFVVFGGGGGCDSWEECAQRAGKAYALQDIDTICDLMPFDMLELIEDAYKQSGMTGSYRSRIAAQREQLLAELKEEYGSYKITVETEDTLPYTAEELRERLNGERISPSDVTYDQKLDMSKIQEGMGAELKITITGSNGESDEDHTEALFIKYDGDWYLIDIM